MIFLINGSYTIWVAIPMLNKAYFTSWKYPYILSVDLATFFLTAILILRASTIIMSSNIFHINLRVILVFQLCQWFETVLARYLMFPYMIGRRFLGDTHKIYHHYWTEDVEEMVPVPSLTEEWPLFLGGFLYTHHYASCLFFLLSVSVERAIASYYLSDYELHTRSYISAVLILTSLLFSAGFSLIFALNFFTFFASSFLILLVGFSSIALYIYVYHYNTKTRKLSLKNHQQEDYSLARTFQTRENLRSLTMAKYVVTTHAVYVALCEICLMCVYLNVESNNWEIFVYVMDTVVYYSNMFIVTFMIFSTKSWRDAFLKPICIIRKMKLKNRVSQSEEVNLEENARRVANNYFEQLGKAWS